MAAAAVYVETERSRMGFWVELAVGISRDFKPDVSSEYAKGFDSPPGGRYANGFESLLVATLGIERSLDVTLDIGSVVEGWYEDTRNTTLGVRAWYDAGYEGARVASIGI